jgi:hypothetical protein
MLLRLTSDGGVLEVLISPSGGWTILVTYPKRPTCVVAVGEAWQPLQLTGGEPASSAARLPAPASAPSAARPAI